MDPASGRSYCCYGCRVLGTAGQVAGASPAAPSQPWVRIGAGALVAGQSMVLGLAANLAQPTGPARLLLHGALMVSAVAVSALLGPALVRQACACARDRRVAVEWLFLAGVAGAFGASLCSTLTGHGAVYYEVVAVLLTVHAAGKALTAATRGRAFAETRRLRDVFARARRVGPDRREETVDVAVVRSGDLVRVPVGEAIPVDGVVERGESTVRETPMTGEGVPVMRRVGDAVLAGSFAEDGELEVRATASGGSRRLDGVLAAVEEARGTLAATAAQRGTDRLAAVFLPAVVGVALATFAWWAWQGRPGDGLFNALSVLLVACPCALGLATPLALWHGLAALASRGIVVRSAAALERAADLRQVFVDKTGTLSEVEPVLVDFVAGGDAAFRAAVLARAAAVQARSPHPLARPFGTADARERFTARAFRPVPGNGVEAWVVDPDGAERCVRVGRPEWIAPSGLPPWASALRTRAGDALVALSQDGVVAGVGAVRESVRAGAPALVSALRELGCGVTVLSGDREDRVSSVAASVGADRALAGLTPSGKAEAIGPRREGIAMVGDGINDAAALAASDVGFAVGGGTALATATADVVLAGDDLGGVAEVIRVARSVRRAVRSSLGFAVFYNAVGMALAAAGMLHPVVAALLMVGSSAVVSWRALRPGAVACAPVPGPTAAAGAGPWTGLPVATGFLLQVPAVVWLGQLGPGPAGMVALAGALLALGSVKAFAARAGRDGRLGGIVRSSLAMLGPGNLLMLAGWWADAGFGPVMQEGVCLCCRSHHYFQLGARVPWMHLGMLAGGLPMMALEPVGWGRPAGRVRVLLAGSAGMVAGMGFGAECALRWGGPGHPHQFLLALAGMTAGMLGGMHFACGVAEAMAGAWRMVRR